MLFSVLRGEVSWFVIAGEMGATSVLAILFSYCGFADRQFSLPFGGEVPRRPSFLFRERETPGVPAGEARFPFSFVMRPLSWTNLEERRW